MTVRFKPEVRIVYLTEQLAAVLQLAALWSLRTRVDVEVNSIDDGAAGRLADTLHGCSLAIDLDTVGDKQPDTQQLADWLRRMLEPQYDLVWEGTHVHVEWDVHRPPLLRRQT
jgi:hypothetical protein